MNNGLPYYIYDTMLSQRIYRRVTISSSLQIYCASYNVYIVIISVNCLETLKYQLVDRGKVSKQSS